MVDQFEKSILFNILELNLNSKDKAFEHIKPYANLTKEFKIVIDNFTKIPASIFGCNDFFSSLPKNTYIYDIVNDFLHKNKVDSEKDVKTFLSLLHQFNDSILNKYSKEEIFTSILLFLYFFLQENIYGPSYFYIKETEKIDYSKRLNNEYYNNFFFFIEKSYESNNFIDYISIAGERPYKNIKLSLFFVLAYEIIMEFDYFKEYSVSLLWKSRLLFLRNKMLPEVIFSIRQTGFEYFDEFLNKNGKLFNKYELGLLLTEKASYCIRFYKYKENRALLEEVKGLFDLKLNLTGIKAKRTKYQEESTVQLILQNKNDEYEKESHEEYIHKEIKKDEGEDDELPLEDIKEKMVYHNNIKLDEVDRQNYILEKLNIDSEEKQSFEDYIVNIYDQIYVASLLTEYKKSFPDQDLLREEIKAYTTKCLKNSYNWLVFSKLLIHRSLAEDKSSKTIERSLLQIQSICDQHNDRDPIPFERSCYTFSIDYPFLFQNKKKYAEMFMGYGSTMTAFEIFKDLELWEDAINCLFIADKVQQAKDLANERMKINPEPSVLCALGELMKDEKYFLEALTLSNGKYTKAYRSLGYFYFGKNQIDKAIENFEKALDINPLFPNIWFTLGCLYLSKRLFEKSIYAFNQSLSIDDESAEAWANLGISFSQVNKQKEALRCLEEGFKRNRKNWKICENIMIISINCKNIGKLIFSIENLFSLKMQERVKPGVIAKLIEFFITNTLSDHEIQYFRKKILQIFDTYTQLDGLKPEIWDLYCLFLEKVEIVMNKNISESKEKTASYYKQILELRSKQIRNYFIDDWEKNESKFDIILDLCNKIENELIKFKLLLNVTEIELLAYHNEISHFINEVREKIKNLKIKNKE